MKTFSFTILIQFQEFLAFCETDLASFRRIGLFDWLVFLSVEPDWRLGRFGQWGDLIRGRSPAHPVSLLVNGVICLSRLLIGHDEALARSDWRRRDDVGGEILNFLTLDLWPGQNVVHANYEQFYIFKIYSVSLKGPVIVIHVTPSVIHLILIIAYSANDWTFSTNTVYTCNADVLHLKTRTPSPQSDALDVCVSASDMMPDGN